MVLVVILSRMLSSSREFQSSSTGSLASADPLKEEETHRRETMNKRTSNKRNKKTMLLFIAIGGYITTTSLLLVLPRGASAWSSSGSLSPRDPLLMSGHEAASRSHQHHQHQHHHQLLHHHNQQQLQHAAHHQAPSQHTNNHLIHSIQARAGGLDPSDYVDEAGELEIMSGQQQIPTAQLLGAAGHAVPENFFLPGTSIPDFMLARFHHNQQQNGQQQQHAGQQQQAAIQPEAYVTARGHPVRRPPDLMEVAASAQDQVGAPESLASLIEFNSYQMGPANSQQLNSGQLGASSVGQENALAGSQQASGSAGDMLELVGGGPVSAAAAMATLQNAAAYEQQQHLVEQQIAADLAAYMARERELSQQQQVAGSSANLDNAASEQAAVDQYAAGGGQHLGPAYQIVGAPTPLEQAAARYPNMYKGVYGLPTKSSNRKPQGLLEPMGNPKTVSSPIIDFVANQVPKTGPLEKLAEKLPTPPQNPPTVFSFSSQSDPVGDKSKAVQQKKRNVMRQAEQFAKMMVKTVNEKFGLNLGDQTDIPFLLSSFGPLGFAQNVLLDPSLINTLLNSAEKTYMSDILPSPAKLAMRPVLNIFRVPNKKRDKANLSNIISFLASGGQMPASTPKHRQGTGIERHANKKSTH